MVLAAELLAEEDPNLAAEIVVLPVEALAGVLGSVELVRV
jgi:hypothetical protein